jgi:hypothetical protein
VASPLLNLRSPDLPYIFIMATLLPPPKRRKLYHGVPEPPKAPETPVSNIVVQFVNEEDGTPLAPAVNLPADLSRDGLEKLLNKLSDKVRFLKALALWSVKTKYLYTRLIIFYIGR